MLPFWTTNDGETVQIFHGNSVEVTKSLPSRSVHTVVTSPPYWGMRDYGNDKTEEIGSEETPQLFVERLVSLFREIRRVLRDDGTVWLNLGDTYGNQANGNTGLPEGNILGIPWKVAIALQDDGWVLRQDIIWDKPSCMPDSVTNRCTKSHEYIFLLSKSMSYYYDQEAIKEGAQNRSCGNKPGGKSGSAKKGFEIRDFSKVANKIYSVRNKRSVWHVASNGYPGAHFAVFPEKLIEPCILAGTSAKGCCPECGAGWDRVLVEVTGKKIEGESKYARDRSLKPNRNGVDSTLDGEHIKKETVGWKPGCECYGVKVQSLFPRDKEDPRYSYKVEKWWEWWNKLKVEYEELETVPAIVLDPFLGSGTTAEVATEHGRQCWGIELSKEYILCNAIPRIEGHLASKPSTLHLVQKKIQSVL
jgi:DNA modification methylase